MAGLAGLDWLGLASWVGLAGLGWLGWAGWAWLVWLGKEIGFRFSQKHWAIGVHVSDWIGDVPRNA